MCARRCAHLPDRDRMGPRDGEREDHMGPRAGEREGRMGPRAGEHQGHMGPGLVSVKVT